MIIIMITYRVVETTAIEEIGMDMVRMIGEVAFVLHGKMRWTGLQILVLLPPEMEITRTSFVGKGPMM